MLGPRVFHQRFELGAVGRFDQFELIMLMRHA
jgi:hypothetical protein